jgi:tRNA pseudouridine55 synthase
MARKRKGREISGILVIDKPSGMTSNGVLQKVKWLYQAQKAGHTGALDPIATGVLPICLGEATKFSQRLLDSDKRYTSRVQLGETRDTADVEGKVVATSPIPVLTRESIETALSQYRGEITQVPPMYSALKHQGKKLYELAREGVEFDIASKAR